jgi:hypothetical protein
MTLMANKRSELEAAIRRRYRSPIRPRATHASKMTTRTASCSCGQLTAITSADPADIEHMA